MTDRRRGLGRGLGALIPSGPPGDRPTDVFFPRDRFTGNDGRDDHSGADGTGTVSPNHEGSAPSPLTAPRPQGDRTGAPTLTTTSGSTPATHLEDAVPRANVSEADTDGLRPVPGARFVEIPVDQIRPNPRQPRVVFDEDDLAELVASITELGVLQPVVVRPVPGGSESSTPFELVMGERRWRASQVAGRATVPAIVRTTDDEHMLRDALLENLHRAQLNPLEEAAAYQQLLDDFGCTQEVLAQRIGRSRPQISNTIRLLKLPPLVQRRVASGVLSAGHARALLSLPDGAAMERLAQRIVAEGLSVRSVEEIVVMGDADQAPRTSHRRATPSPELQQVAADLSDRLDTRVQVTMGRSKGKITVEFAGEDDLRRILDALGRP